MGQDEGQVLLEWPTQAGRISHGDFVQCDLAELSGPAEGAVKVLGAPAFVLPSCGPQPSACCSITPDASA
eukprot:13465237-Alexandrium_andersonii.AAC.1